MKYDENSASEQFIKMFSESMQALSQLKPTYCGEICYKMRKGASDIVETVESYYTASGTMAIIKDKRDGQEYTVEIKPYKRK